MRVDADAPSEAIPAPPTAASRWLRIGPELLWVGGGQLLAVASVVLGIRFLAGRLGPAAYGELALATTVVTLSQQLLIGPVTGALLRMYAQAQEADEASHLWRAGRRLLDEGAAIVALLTVLAALAMAGAGHGAWVPILVAATCYAVQTGYGTAMNALQQAARHRAIVAWHQGGGEALRMIVAVLMVDHVARSSAAAMTGYVLASAVVLASQAYWLRRHRVLRSAPGHAVDLETTREWRRRLMDYSWPFVAMGPFLWAQVASERWALQVADGTASVGRYVLIYQLGYVPTTIVSTMMINLISPIVFARAGSGTDPIRLRSIRTLVLRLAVVGLVTTVATTALAFATRNSIFAILAPASFRDSAHLWPLMILAGGLFSVGQTAALLPLARGISRVLVRPGIVMAVGATITNILAARTFGLGGVVLANVCYTAVYALWNVRMGLQATASSGGALPAAEETAPSGQLVVRQGPR